MGMRPPRAATLISSYTMWDAYLASRVAQSLDILGVAGAEELRSHVRARSVPPDTMIELIQEDVFEEFLRELDEKSEPSRRGKALDELTGKLECLKSTFS